MPKGKAKKNNPTLYESDSEPPKRSMAPQAMPHRRGGKHRVKDEDLTHSVYDSFSYAEVLNLAKERGIYRKDMKKKEMAMANMQYDADVQSHQRRAIIEHRKREVQKRKAMQEKDYEKQAAMLAKYERNMQKQMRRAEGLDVSDDSLDEAEIEAEHQRLMDVNEYEQEDVGVLLSDESWDSTSTDSTAHCPNRPVEPDCRLRLYEWLEEPYNPHMSSGNMMSLPGFESILGPDSKEWSPSKVPYAPLKVITIGSRQKMILPGQAYPPGVQPDFVPVLGQRTRAAARNGVLEGVLRKATIEKASDWAKRTQIQGDTATMIFHLPARNEAKSLAETYNKWYLENRKLLRVKGRGECVSAGRAKRHAQRSRNKIKKVVEVFEACRYRPSGICYVPSYLDFNGMQYRNMVVTEDEDRTLENLFYVRFPGCDVPHYYFWTRRGEWKDPTERNPYWDASAGKRRRSLTLTTFDVLSDSDSSDQAVGRVKSREPRKKPWSPPAKTWIRVKRRDAGNAAHTSLGMMFEAALSFIEYELYANGLLATLLTCRERWVSNGKQHAWDKFSRALPAVYPSGSLPLVPSTPSTPIGHPLAVKIARIDTLEPDETTLLSPFHGREAWTRDDDAFWDLVQVDEMRPLALMKDDDTQAQLERSNDIDNGLLIDRCPVCSMDWATLCVGKKAKHLLSHGKVHTHGYVALGVSGQAKRRRKRCAECR